MFLPVPVQGIKISRRILDLDQKMPSTTQSDGFHKAEESMTEKSGNKESREERFTGTQKPLMGVRKGDLL